MAYIINIFDFGRYRKNKLQLIKVIRDCTSLNLEEAKGLVCSIDLNKAACFEVITIDPKLMSEFLMNDVNYKITEQITDTDITPQNCDKKHPVFEEHMEQIGKLYLNALNALDKAEDTISTLTDERNAYKSRCDVLQKRLVELKEQIQKSLDNTKF